MVNKIREQRFDNNASQVMFVGNRSLDSVIAEDERELAEIGGSFEAVADRVQEFVSWVMAKGYVLEYEEQSAHIKPIYDEWKDKILADDPKAKEDAWKEYKIELGARMAEHPKTWFDDKVAIVQYLTTRGFQVCPFKDCRTNCWNEDVYLVSRKTGKQLTVNRGTAHLAKEHHLLEKENEYGINAREFYESFMPE